MFGLVVGPGVVRLAPVFAAAAVVRLWGVWRSAEMGPLLVVGVVTTRWLEIGVFKSAASIRGFKGLFEVWVWFWFWFEFELLLLLL